MFSKTQTRTYHTWEGMIQRCTNKRCKDFARYGTIVNAVCPRWRKFENFLSDMGARPTGKTLDKINNNKGYCKSNCRWATNSQQQDNQRSAIFFKGEKHSVVQWAIILGFSNRSVIQNRIRRGWSIRKALTTPQRKYTERYRV